MKKIIELAREISKELITKERDDGTEFICLKDCAPEWIIRLAIRPVHGDKLPDDTTYRFIQKAVDAIADCAEDTTEDDIRDRLNEIEPDCYTSDLTAWLNARNDHVYYLTEALEEFDTKDGFQALSIAQGIQIQEVAEAVLSALQGIKEGTI